MIAQTPEGGGRCARVEAARSLARLGFPVMPLHSPVFEGGSARCSCGPECNGSAAKHPRTRHGLKDASADEAEIDRWWGRWPEANIGWLMGGGYFALDIDTAKGGDEGIEALVAEHEPLPDTLTILTGGGGRHLIFRAPEGVKTKPSAGALAVGVDVRGDGSYLVGPGSVHISGREYVVDELDETVSLDRITEAPPWLVDLVRADRPKPARARRAAPAAGKSTADPCAPIAEGKRNEALTSLAGTMRRRGMTEDAIAAALIVTNRDRCRPPLDEDEVRTIARSVAGYEPSEDAADGPGLVPLGECDPVSGRLVLSPKRTLPTAEAYISEFHLREGLRTLHGYGGQFLEWRSNRYVVVEDDAFKARLQPWLHAALRYQKKRNGDVELVPFDSNPTTVNASLESIRTRAYLPADAASPCWLHHEDGRPPASEILPCRTMNLHIPSRRELAATPALFTTNALDFDYDADPEPPERWIHFLEQLWEDDLDAVRLLQEWMGYCLTSDTSQQKMLMLVGPRRSGKGTVGRVLTRLVGSANVAGPTIGSLAGDFGLQPLIGKSLAIVSDARFSGQKMPVVIERLLCISGEDMVSVDRKYLGAVNMKLPTRFVFLTNELPRLVDASAALAGRFLVLPLANSFYGREDTTLADQLIEELPGILLWALDGWRRLRERGHFVQPASGEEAIQQLEDLASPVKAFARARCEVKPGVRCDLDDLYQAWRDWCQEEGRDHVTPKATFGRDLRSAYPHIRRREGTTGAFYDGICLRPGYQPGGYAA